MYVPEPPEDGTDQKDLRLQFQANFKVEKSLLQITLEEAGHKCYFLPKFPCELNPLEMY